MQMILKFLGALPKTKMIDQNLAIDLFFELALTAQLEKKHRLVIFNISKSKLVSFYHDSSDNVFSLVIVNGSTLNKFP